MEWLIFSSICLPPNVSTSLSCSSSLSYMEGCPGGPRAKHEEYCIGPSRKGGWKGWGSHYVYMHIYACSIFVSIVEMNGLMP